MVIMRLIPAVVYYRMSTDKQDASITQQRIAVEKYAKEHGYRIVREYIDKGISGDTTEKRFEFQRMIQDCSSGEFEVVLCWDQDRFGRFDPLEAGYWIKPMRDAGVRLVTVAQGKINWDDFAGRIVWTVQQEAKNSFLKDLSRNSTRGTLETVKQGKWVGGKPPYGYALDENHQLTLGESAEIKTVEHLFVLYLDGFSLRGIAEKLNAECLQSPSGGAWCDSTIRSILRNPNYTGSFVWGRVSKGKFHRIMNGEVNACRKQDKVKRNSIEDCVVIENNHEPLIDSDMFHRVQRRLNERKCLRIPVRNGGKFVLSGLLKCGHCGSSMVGSKSTQKGKYVYWNYACSGYNRKGKNFCSRNTVRQDPIVKCLIHKLQNDFLDLQNVDRLREELRAQCQKKSGQADGNGTKRQIAETERRLKKAEKRLLKVDDDMIPIIQQEIRRLRNQRDEHIATLNASRIPHESNVDKTVERAMEILSELHRRFSDTNPMQLRELFGEMVDHVDLWFDSKPYGKRVRHEFAKGVIWLKKDSRIIQDVSSALAHRATPVNQRSAGVLGCVGSPKDQETEDKNHRRENISGNILRDGWKNAVFSKNSLRNNFVPFSRSSPQLLETCEIIP